MGGLADGTAGAAGRAGRFPTRRLLASDGHPSRQALSERALEHGQGALEDVVSMPRWMSRRVLVTGATGIIGSWVARRLVEEGAHVIALVLDNDQRSELFRSGTAEHVAIVSGRLEAYDDLERALVLHEPDTVLHLGAQTLVGSALRAPLITLETNVRGTYNLLEACRRHDDLVS